MRKGTLAAALLLSALSTAAAFAQTEGETRLLRFPDIDKDKIVFSYGGDLWLVGAEGGTALRLTADPGEELFAKFSSSWPSPSFGGNTLPIDSKISPEGFEANWQTTEFGSPRITASLGIMDAAMWKGATIGVDLIEATPIYRMINRVAKYGLLFVVLSFATYFFFELLSRLQIHIVQYGLLGLSLSLFSLLLVSLAEPVGAVVRPR